MKGPAGRTLGVVVVYEPQAPVEDLEAVKGLRSQVDELLVVLNGSADDRPDRTELQGATTICFAVNKGTAAAWNAALDYASDRGFDYLFLLDQDSRAAPDAVSCAVAAAQSSGAVAVLQPVSGSSWGLVRFPWNAAASGCLLSVKAVGNVGGFDESLFVDGVDHELFERLLASGQSIHELDQSTVEHRAGRPHTLTVAGRSFTVLGHGVWRRRLHGRSLGLLVRRYARCDTKLAARLFGLVVVLTVKDLLATDIGIALAFGRGFLTGLCTPHPPPRASTRACPYCGGLLVGRWAAVPDWRFGNGEPADVYECESCGALAAGTVPDASEIASWYATYYTHQTAESRRHVWSRLWPTPRRLEELERLNSYMASPDQLGRFLEVGAGSGERLVPFHDSGWQVVGQDPDPRAGVAAKERGIVVHHCDVGNLVGREEPFDLIGLSHVIEHVPDPGKLLQACTELLAPNGRVCVIAPNARSLGSYLFGRWWFGLDQPRHLAIPTIEAFRRLGTRIQVDTVQLESSAANAAVVLGGSLSGPAHRRSKSGNVSPVIHFGSNLVGQAIGRLAVMVNKDFGEEVVWLIGRRESEPEVT